MAQTRAVLLRHAVGAIGHESPGNDRNDALVADPSLVGLTVSWLPGDHGLTLLVGGGAGADGQITEPALSIFVHHFSVPRLYALAERLVSLTPVIGAPPKTELPIKDHEDARAVPDYEDYDGRQYPFGSQEPLVWGRHVRCIYLAERLNRHGVSADHAQTQAASPNLSNPFREELDLELVESDFTGTAVHPEDPAGYSGMITLYQADETGWRPNEQRIYVLQIQRHHVPQRGRFVRIYLERPEVHDLLAVFRHKPVWERSSLNTPPRQGE